MMNRQYLKQTWVNWLIMVVLIISLTVFAVATFSVNKADAYSQRCSWKTTNTWHSNKIFPCASPAPTPTPAPTPSPTPSPAPTPAPSPSPSPTPTLTPSPTPSPTPTITPTPTLVPSPQPEDDDDDNDNDGEEEPAALAITKTDHKDLTRPGHTLTYEIEVKNTGEGTIDDLKVIDTLPSQVALEQVTSNPHISGRTITWGNIALSGGEVITFFATVKVSDQAKNGQTLTNVVKVRSEDKGLSATDTDTTVVDIGGRIIGVAIDQPATAVPVTAKTGADAATIALALVTGTSGLLASFLRRRIG